MFLSIIGLNLCLSSLSYCINAGTPLYIQEAGQPAVYGGLLISTFIIAIIISRLISGALVDLYSRQKIILIGACLVIVGSLLPLAFSALAAKFVAHVLQGLGFAAVHNSVSACAADVLPKEHLGEGIGYFGLGQALGMMIGPALAIWLVSLDYPEALSLGCCIVGIIAFVLGLLIRYENNLDLLPETAGFHSLYKQRLIESKTLKGKKEPFHFSFSQALEKSALSGAVPMLFLAIVFSIFFSYCTVYANAQGYSNPTLFFVVAAVVTLVIRLTASKVMDSARPLKIYAFPVVIGCLTLAGIYLITNEFVYYALGVGYGLCIGIAVPFLNTIVIKTAKPNRVGAASALFFLMYDIGLGLGAILWSSTLDYFGFAPMFLGGILLFVASFIAARIFFPRV